MKSNTLFCFPGGSDGKESACKAGDLGLIPGLGRIPWRRTRQPTPIFLPGESHGQKSLAGYSLWVDSQESDMAEQLSTCSLLLVDATVSGAKSSSQLSSSWRAAGTWLHKGLMEKLPKMRCPPGPPLEIGIRPFNASAASPVCSQGEE